jgi:hypothetical protein
MLTPPNEALKRIGDGPIGLNQLAICWAIGLWYNGKTFRRKGKNLRIDTSRPPKLKTLLDCTETEYENQIQPSFEKLIDQGWLRGFENPESILRKQVPWAPTKAGRAAIGDLFREEFSEEFSDSVFHYHTGLVGDWDETLTHRTMVEVANQFFLLEGRASGKNNPGIERYPGKHGQHRPDLGDENFGVEAITDHNDLHSIADKYQHFTKKYSGDHENVWWVFDNRETAFKVLSHLHEAEWIDCRIVNAPFENPGNYSIKTGNDYIWRSRGSEDHCCQGISTIKTLSAMYRHIEDIVTEHFVETDPHQKAV